MIETLVYLETVCQDQGGCWIVVFNVVLDHFMTVLDFILVKLLLDLVTPLHESQLSLELSILLFEPSNDDSWVYSLIPLDVILDQSDSHGKFTGCNTFENILFLGRHSGNHTGFAVSSN